jgi:hypothetical protein
MHHAASRMKNQDMVLAHLVGAVLLGVESDALPVAQLVEWRQSSGAIMIEPVRYEPVTSFSRVKKPFLRAELVLQSVGTL